MKDPFDAILTLLLFITADSTRNTDIEIVELIIAALRPGYLIAQEQHYEI